VPAVEAAVLCWSDAVSVAHAGQAGLGCGVSCLFSSRYAFAYLLERELLHEFHLAGGSRAGWIGMLSLL
jgi:hypothetical protein